MTMEPDSIWSSFTLDAGQTLVWDVGATRLTATRTANDWLIARAESEEKEEATVQIHSDAIEGEPKYERWAFKNPRPTIHIQPSMPDRPLVVRPIAPLGLPPESEVQFYINIPVFIKLSFSHSQRQTDLVPFSSQQLSNTWFGDNFSGVLCYANKSSIRRENEELTVVPNHIICPFKIKNRGDEILHVERICLRVRYLSIWAGQKRLWSNEVTTTFRGHGKETQLEYANSAPKDATKPRLLVKAEERAERGFLRQTFGHAPFPWRKDNAS